MGNGSKTTRGSQAQGVARPEGTIRSGRDDGHAGEKRHVPRTGSQLRVQRIGEQYRPQPPGCPCNVPPWERCACSFPEEESP
jgi:hypothetical protein